MFLILKLKKNKELKINAYIIKLINEAEKRIIGK